MRGPGFTGSPLDRADRIRNDIEAYGALLGDWRARILGLDGLDPIVGAEGGLRWHSIAELQGSEELILLGLSDGKPHFVALVEVEGGMFRSPALWRALSMLPAEDAAIYGTARSLIDWHNSHRFCGKCGSPTAMFRAGWGRKCNNCGKEHFPRTDPVVIMLVTKGDKVLLGRQKQFPPGMWSCLAGFVEVAETIEDAVRREILEESGIVCGDVGYYLAQPWPYPSSLMIGCTAVATTDEIIVDRMELEDARWFSRDDARLMLKREHPDGLTGPHPVAIAHHLLGHWLQD